MKHILPLFCLVLLAVVFGGCKTGPNDDPTTVKVLMIGNSFSISCLKHLPQVAADRGVDLDIASLYIGGCSLKRHWENVVKEEEGDASLKPYRFDRYIKGRHVVHSTMNLCAALELAKWNVVTIQQASHDSWQEKTYEPYGSDLIAKIRELAPTARIVVQETWSYTPWDKRLKKWNLTPSEMYAKLKGANATFAARHGLELIPMGAAVEAWRRELPVAYTENSFGGDVVGGRHQKPEDAFNRTLDNTWVPNCDVFHLNEKGEYFQALVWATCLLDIDLEELEYRPEEISEGDANLMRKIASELQSSKDTQNNP